MAKRVVDYLTKIYEASMKFLVPLTPEETYPLIVHEAMKLVGGNSGIIMLQIKGRLQPVYHTSSILSPKPRKGGLATRVFKSRQAFVATPKQIHPESAKAGVKSVIFIPLAYKNKSMGVLAVRSVKKNFFDEEKLEILKLFGAMTSLAIRKTQLYEETQKALETRDLFLSMAAHEFRTPLTTIGGYTQLMTNTQADSKQIQKWAKELYWESGRLTSLVNEFLDVTKIRGHKMRYILRENSLKNIINKAISEFQFSHYQQNIVFRNELGKASDRILCDFEKMLQVISNLLENAAKFSEPDSRIIISLKSNTHHLTITIRDYGIGIPKEEKPRIFDAFYQSKSEKGGAGLGLFLAKSIIEAHHGTIRIISKPHKGTNVEIKLPKAKI